MALFIKIYVILIIGRVIKMYGAIIGDLAGSIYEYDQINKVKEVKINNIIEDNSFYSDDTILTIAVMDAMLNNKDFEYYLKKYAKEYMNYKPNISPYFKTTFSPGFTKWVYSNEKENSKGNGAMMRISPIGYLSNSVDEVVEYSKLATIPSHNSKESVDCATTIALIIYLAKNNYSKEEIIKLLNLKYFYSPFKEFNYTCSSTINNCLYALFTSNNYEECIKKVISFGGDTDTNACIVGSMAEALYGIDKSLVDKAISKLPNEFVSVLEKGYQNIKKIKKVNR